MFIISVTCVEFEKSLSIDLAKQIAVALVSSKLDYCNSLFHNMPEKDIARLFIHGSLQIGHFISIFSGVIIVTVNIEIGGRIEFEALIKVKSFQ